MREYTQQDTGSGLPGKHIFRNMFIIFVVVAGLASLGSYTYERGQTIERLNIQSQEMVESLFEIESELSNARLIVAEMNETLDAYRYALEKLPVFRGAAAIPRYDVSAERELTGFVEDDADGDGLPDDIDLHPGGEEVNIPRTFRWFYSGKWHNITFLVPYDWFDFYANRKRATSKEQYITPHAPLIVEISEKLKKIIIENGYTSYGEFVISFVQAIPFLEDEDTKGGPYPRFPIETLEEYVGDCEDLTFVAVSILSNLGIDTVMIDIPNHIVPGVACSNCEGSHVEFGGRDYYWLEPTVQGYRLGQAPPEWSRFLNQNTLVRAIGRA